MITQPPIKMKPCPVCEHRAELTDDSDGYETPTFYVNCACDAGACLLGPNRPTAEEAIAEWNDLSDAMQVFQMAKRIGND